jgi:membrane-associated phospholipid phosphatase
MKVFWLLLLILSSASLRAQGPYHISKADCGLGAFAFGLATGGYFVEKNVAPLSVSARAQLQISHIPVFDRFNAGNWRSGAAQASNLLFGAAMLAPLTTLLGKEVRSSHVPLIVIGAETGLLTYGLTNLSKGLVHRVRPFAYGSIAPDEEVYAKDARLSFFSGHTSFTAAACFLGAQVFADHYPEARIKPFVWTAAASFPLVVAYLRVRAGKHFLSDVLAGYVVGAATGILIPRLHRRQSDRPLSLQPAYFGNGVGLHLSYRW